MREKILQVLRETDGFVSGQEISERFGVSRTSVWKAVRQLEDMGYRIEAVRNRGYRLCSEPDLLTADRVAESLQTAWAGQPLFFFESLDSTNNEAKRRAEEGAAEGLLVIGEEQTAGRGRLGRSWASEKGGGIFFSLLLRPDIVPADASMLTLVAGLAVRDALEEICPGSPEIMIKWPNDIIIEGKKVCGILTEMSAEINDVHYIVIGVGINVHNERFSGNVAQTATSIYLETGQHICRAELIAACLRRIEEFYGIFLETQDLSAFVDEYNARLINRDREVLVLDPQGGYAGTARGINAGGGLLVETGEGIRIVSSGEVSVRGVCGYV